MSFNADDYLAHHGIKGQKWGVRRFQNSDGSLTEDGKRRYYKSGDGKGPMTNAGKKALAKAYYDLKKAYGIKEYADQLEPSYHAFKKAEAASIDQYEKFKNLPSDDPELKKHVNTELKNRLDYADSDDFLNALDLAGFDVNNKKEINSERESFKAMWKEEANDLISGRNRSGNLLMQPVYSRYKKANGLQKADDDYIAARDNYYKDANAMGKESYKNGGREPYDTWVGIGPNNVDKDTKSHREDIISYLIREEVEHRKSKSLEHSSTTNPSDYLVHHGIKGQKWGVRRFQNPDGSLTSEGRKRYLTTDLKKKISDLRKKSSKKVSDVRKKIAKIRSEKEEADKKSAIAKGDLDRIYRHIDKMSTNEINDAINRATAIKNLKNLSDKKSVLNRLANTAGNLSNYGNKFVDLANTVKRMKELTKKEDKKEDTDKDYEYYMRNVKEKAKRAANSARDNTNGSSADKEHAAASVYKRMMNDAKASYDKVKSGDYYKDPSSEETKGKKLGDHVESLQDKSVRDVAKERSTSASRGNARLAEINKREGWTATSSLAEMAKAHSDEKERKGKRRAKTKTIKIKGSMMGGRSHYAD